MFSQISIWNHILINRSKLGHHQLLFSSEFLLMKCFLWLFLTILNIWQSRNFTLKFCERGAECKIEGEILSKCNLENLFIPSLLRKSERCIQHQEYFQQYKVIAICCLSKLLSVVLQGWYCYDWSDNLCCNETSIQSNVQTVKVLWCRVRLKTLWNKESEVFHFDYFLQHLIQWNVS